jgi:hypothetical protein
LPTTLQVLREFLMHHSNQRFVHLMNQATTLRQTPHQLVANMLRQFRTMQRQEVDDVGVKELRS